ncbi:hypothetical protein GCM10009504_47170 [Pseudomonas laurentiana]|uniref:hypothetical protein n=1 Tax=Pseudomonas laurentiana TaxID=2364649 RepID=UPI001676E78E|nr:hypothetical protein [Pseudomonas laurentiana]GGU85809.1 hypothetical protein GCM10009504_47170 [Pseudomonas laurentiana]
MSYEEIKKFSVYGTVIGSDQLVRLDEVSVIADPETIKSLGEFFIKASHEISKDKLEHVHLQDFIECFSEKKHVDIILLNKKLVLRGKG